MSSSANFAFEYMCIYQQPCHWIRCWSWPWSRAKTFALTVDTRSQNQDQYYRSWSGLIWKKSIFSLVRPHQECLRDLRPWSRD